MLTRRDDNGESGIVLYSLGRIVAGAGLAAATIWIVGLFFCRNFSVFEWSPSLRRNVYAAGTRCLLVSEGYAATAMGSDGAIAPDADWNAPGGIWLLMGNSYVEGLHVADSNKLHAVANASLRRTGVSGRVINVAMSSQCLQDIVWQLPRYLEKHGQDINGVIVPVIAPDLIPRSSSRFGAVVQMPEYRLSSPAHSVVSPWAKIKYYCRLNAFLKLGARACSTRLDFRLGPRNPVVTKMREPSLPQSVFSNETLRFLDWELAELRRCTDKPIVLLWISDQPYREGNEWLPGAESEEFHLLCRLARKNGIEVCSMREGFNRFFEANRRRKLICGFANTVPGAGHMNEAGHRLCGEWIAAWVAARSTR